MDGRFPVGNSVQIEAMPEIEIPDADDLEPQVKVYTQQTGDEAFWWQAQPYTLIICGEKTSLAPVIEPVAQECNASVFLPTSKMPDSMIYQMVRMIEECERPAVVFYLSDFDLSGFSMPKNVGLRLQAMQDLGHLPQDFALHPVALTYEQCEELDLPFTPIKEMDKRAQKWIEATGREQTEVDALATLQPRVLRKILREAVAPFWDETLRDRIFERAEEHQDEQNERLADQIAPDQMRAIRDQIAENPPKAEELIEEIRRQTAFDVGDYDLDPLILPEPECDGLPINEPLVDFGNDWLTAAEKLIARKKYEV